MDQQKTNSEPTDKQFYDYIVDHLKREHGLADNRMGWMLTSQAFLFAAFGAINSTNFSPLDDASKESLNVAIPTVGLTVGIAVLLGLLGTNIAVRAYRYEWAAKPDDLKRRFPPTSGWGVPHGLGLFSTLIIPLVVCFAWALVLSRHRANPSSVMVFGVLAAAILFTYVICDAQLEKRLPDRSLRKETPVIEDDNRERKVESV